MMGAYVGALVFELVEIDEGLALLKNMVRKQKKFQNIFRTYCIKII